MLNCQEAKFKEVLLYMDYPTTATLVDFYVASHVQLHSLTISIVYTSTIRCRGTHTMSGGG